MINNKNSFNKNHSKSKSVLLINNSSYLDEDLYNKFLTNKNIESN